MSDVLERFVRYCEVPSQSNPQTADHVPSTQSQFKIAEVVAEDLRVLGAEDVSVDESKMKKVKAIIQSMTPAERQNPDSIKGSHKKRIAAGSGTTIQDVNSLLKQFAQVREMMSRMSNIGKRGFRMPF